MSVFRLPLPAVLVIISVVAVVGSGAWAHGPQSAPPAAAKAKKSAEPRLAIPKMDASAGKVLFVTKGCVACHAVNGVGGHDAPNLDGHTMQGMMNPFEFAAKMWNHAPAMIAAQEGAFGEMITLTGQELADITAFVHHDEMQHRFTEADLTEKARLMMHHDHGGKAAETHHGPEIGHMGGAVPSGHHPHPPGTPVHKN